MTDEELIERVEKYAAEASSEALMFLNVLPVQYVLAHAYMKGISELATFLTKLDGLVTPQQFTRVMSAIFAKTERELHEKGYFGT